MSILDALTAQINDAQKQRDAVRRDALRLVRDALQKELKDQGSVDEVAVLKRERKRRLQSAEIYTENGRTDLAAAEQSEADLIETFLPKQLGEDELAALVDAAIAETGATTKRDMGAVMKHVLAAAGDGADGKVVSGLVA
ncbi:MAG: GatB/YqeY domain-containing protein, partial [Solirubrobacteraceae bacterium]|nr:GatB/YqeY domain-containing protein [Solirubrobacteraceae bacterium]